MPINVLILEDRKYTRRVIWNYLGSYLARDASEKWDPSPDATGGQLAHVLPHGWQPFRPRDFKVYCAEDDEIKLLIDAAQSADRAQLREHVKSICKEAFVGEPELPDVLVVDLALCDYEQRELMAEEHRWPAMECYECNPPKPDSIVDPRPLVDNMTGFKVLGAHAGEVPIIATSFASHPLVSRHCLINGARAFVRKPVRETEAKDGRKGWDWMTADKHGIDELERLGDQALDPLAAVVLNHLTTLSAQILGALPVLALRRLNDCSQGDPRGPALAPR